MKIKAATQSHARRAGKTKRANLIDARSTGANAVGKAFNKLFFRQENESALFDASLFITAFCISAATFYFALSLAGGLPNSIAAHSAAFAGKNLFGLEVNYLAGAPPRLAGYSNGGWFDAEIAGLCSGALELAVLAGMIAATRDKPLKERLKGIVAGGIAILVFNPLRIAATLLFSGSPALALVHDVLFRLSLVIVLVTFYATWYFWVPRTNEQTAK